MIVHKTSNCCNNKSRYHAPKDWATGATGAHAKHVLSPPCHFKFSSYSSYIVFKLYINLVKEQLDEAPDTTMDEFGLIDCTMLLEIVNSLSDSKASGVKDISSRLMFDAISAIPENFVKIINMSLRTGVFPDDWKTARLQSSPKKETVDTSIILDPFRYFQF